MWARQYLILSIVRAERKIILLRCATRTQLRPLTFGPAVRYFVGRNTGLHSLGCALTDRKWLRHAQRCLIENGAKLSSLSIMRGI